MTFSWPHSPEPHTPEPDGLGLLAELSRAVVALATAEDSELASYALPYPPEVQLLYDRLVLHCLDRRVPPPGSVPELMAWCHARTAAAWPFPVPTGLVSAGALLVDPVSRMPTRTCLELASAGPTGVVEQEAVYLLAALRDRAGPPPLYERCRDFLGRHPVVWPDVQRAREWDPVVWHRVRELYGPPPRAFVQDRAVAVCGVCGLPALRALDAGPTAVAWCEGGSCPRAAEPVLHPRPEAVLFLHPGLRAFLALPHRTERAAVRRLASAGVRGAFRPAGLGAHAFTDASGRACVMRVYDREEPGLLAARAAEDFADGPERGLAVVPDGTPRGRPDFRRVFAGLVPPGQRVALMTVSQLGRALRPGATRDQAEEIHA